MGIASLVLGIISAIVGFIPFCGSIAFLPALIGLILGIVYIVQQSKKQLPKGIGIAGVVLCGLALLFVIFWNFIWLAGSAAALEQSEDLLVELENELDNQYTYTPEYDYEYDYDESPFNY